VGCVAGGPVSGGGGPVEFAWGESLNLSD